MTPHVWVLRWAPAALGVLICGCGASGGSPAPAVAASSVCWTLQRTVDGVIVAGDTSDVPSRFEFEVTPQGNIIFPGTRATGQWTMPSADSIRVEWGEGRQRVWLFGSVREGRFTGSGHLFTRFGATVLVTYTGVQRACEYNGARNQQR